MSSAIATRQEREILDQERRRGDQTMRMGVDRLAIGQRPGPWLEPALEIEQRLQSHARRGMPHAEIERKPCWQTTAIGVPAVGQLGPRLFDLVERHEDRAGNVTIAILAIVRTSRTSIDSPIASRRYNSSPSIVP
jgi:hypothetical protein